ncbi:hypothetical protein GUITHDRAFT_166904 [Guillardia theta CCMP2712]|uniref:Uncharacterized protein n=1 Tax=Guillardia theta (strain CCMP2712) TaxID=905079 RepID=L1I510_GUITC|nr:hypothetical protein GUITHDRAFT_166904 [Guillardia theta CCMP2712]EKX31348.1 hypothetical protein GUITHDRAFT_166904 [Guillardia theta CCMP2712]|eukprot:XP_005818328.1 hypothetical protein GUITHDRAFT_166904 [Guillardia theta CCMP2712]
MLSKSNKHVRIATADSINSYLQDLLLANQKQGKNVAKLSTTIKKLQGVLTEIDRVEIPELDEEEKSVPMQLKLQRSSKVLPSQQSIRLSVSSLLQHVKSPAKVSHSRRIASELLAIVDAHPEARDLIAEKLSSYQQRLQLRAQQKLTDADSTHFPPTRTISTTSCRVSSTSWTVSRSPSWTQGMRTRRRGRRSGRRCCCPSNSPTASTRPAPGRTGSLWTRTSGRSIRSMTSATTESPTRTKIAWPPPPPPSSMASQKSERTGTSTTPMASKEAPTLRFLSLLPTLLTPRTEASLTDFTSEWERRRAAASTRARSSAAWSTATAARRFLSLPPPSREENLSDRPSRPSRQPSSRELK